MSHRNRMTVLRRGFGELLVVVVGVLIALWTNAWWQNRSDRKSEVEHLLAMREDFAVSVRLADSAAVDQNGQIAALKHLLAGGARRAPPDSARAWAYWGLWMIVEYAPQLSTLRDLEASGDLRIIRDIELRRALAELDRILGDASVEHADFTTVQQQRMDPFLVERLDLPRLLLEPDRARPGTANPDRTDWRVLESARARNLMAFKLAQEAYDAEPRARIRAQFELLLTLIDRRLAELGHTVR